MLAVRNLEVVYDDVILVLRGISLDVPDGKIVGLLDIHYGKITKGSVSIDDEPIHRHSPARIVGLGVKQSLEGRRIFAELSVDENLRVGAHANRGQLRENLNR